MAADALKSCRRWGWGLSAVEIKGRSPAVQRFDARSLYEALDAQRAARGLSWRQVAEEIGVSPSALTRTRLGGRMEADGMLAMVRWVGRTAESFVRHV